MVTDAINAAFAVIPCGTYSFAQVPPTPAATALTDTAIPTQVGSFALGASSSSSSGAIPTQAGSASSDEISAVAIPTQVGSAVADAIAARNRPPAPPLPKGHASPSRCETVVRGQVAATEVAAKKFKAAGDVAPAWCSEIFNPNSTAWPAPEAAREKKDHPHKMNVQRFVEQHGV